MNNEWKSKILAIFAEQGDIVEVPVEAQNDNQVSFTTGYTKNYSKDAEDELGSPLVRFGIERTKFNYLFKIITSAVKELQEIIPVYTIADTDELKVDIAAITNNTTAFSALTDLLCVDDTGKASKITKEELIAQLNPNIDLSNSNITVTEIAETALNNFLTIDNGIVKKADKLLQEVIEEINLSADNVIVSGTTTHSAVNTVLVTTAEGRVVSANQITQEHINNINLSKSNVTIDHLHSAQDTLKPVFADDNGVIKTDSRIPTSLLEGAIRADSLNAVVMTEEEFPNGVDDLREDGIYTVCSLEEAKDYIADIMNSTNIIAEQRKQYIQKVMEQIVTLSTAGMISNIVTIQPLSIMSIFIDLAYNLTFSVKVLGVSGQQVDDRTITQQFYLNGINTATRMGRLTLETIEWDNENISRINFLSFLEILESPVANLGIDSNGNIGYTVNFKRWTNTDLDNNLDSMEKEGLYYYEKISAITTTLPTSVVEDNWNSLMLKVEHLIGHQNEKYIRQTICPATEYMMLGDAAIGRGTAYVRTSNDITTAGTTAWIDWLDIKSRVTDEDQLNGSANNQEIQNIVVINKNEKVCTTSIDDFIAKHSEESDYVTRGIKHYHISQFTAATTLQDLPYGYILGSSFTQITDLPAKEQLSTIPDYEPSKITYIYKFQIQDLDASSPTNHDQYFLWLNSTAYTSSHKIQGITNVTTAGSTISWQEATKVDVANTALDVSKASVANAELAKYSSLGIEWKDINTILSSAEATITLEELPEGAWYTDIINNISNYRNLQTIISNLDTSLKTANNTTINADLYEDKHNIILKIIKQKFNSVLNGLKISYKYLIVYSSLNNYNTQNEEIDTFDILMYQGIDSAQQTLFYPLPIKENIDSKVRKFDNKFSLSYTAISTFVGIEQYSAQQTLGTLRQVSKETMEQSFVPDKARSILFNTNISSAITTVKDLPYGMSAIPSTSQISDLPTAHGISPFFYYVIHKQKIEDNSNTNLNSVKLTVYRGDYGLIVNNDVIAITSYSQNNSIPIVWTYTKDYNFGNRDLSISTQTSATTQASAVQTVLVYDDDDKSVKKVDKNSLLVGVDTVNLIPVGFIYFQLRGQQTPDELFGTSGKWQDVSATYAGEFFRAVGGDSEAFGLTQVEGIPALSGRLNSILFKEDPRFEGLFMTISHYTNAYALNGGSIQGYADIIIDTTLQSSNVYGKSIHVTPYNSAIRIWKKIA